jgi:tetratricopeptide (TPR) repeat protein
VTIGIKRLHQITVLLSILIGPAEALAQPPAPESPIGAADLFKKTDGPSSDDSPPFARRSTAVSEQFHRYFDVGTTFVREQRFAEAESLYAAAIALAESDDGSPYYLFYGLFFQANVMASQSRLDESRALIERAVRCNPGSAGFDPYKLDYMFDF